MQLEQYLEFRAPDDILIKGTRVGIEAILYEDIHRGRAPEDIARTYPSVTLEQVYATILYYLRNREGVSDYMTDWLNWGNDQRRAQTMAPPVAVARLRELKSANETSTDSDAYHWGS